jgi:hypothetical protein
MMMMMMTTMMMMITALTFAFASHALNPPSPPTGPLAVRPRHPLQDARLLRRPHPPDLLPRLPLPVGLSPTPCRHRPAVPVAGPPGACGLSPNPRRHRRPVGDPAIPRRPPLPPPPRVREAPVLRPHGPPPPGVLEDVRRPQAPSRLEGRPPATTVGRPVRYNDLAVLHHIHQRVGADRGTHSVTPHRIYPSLVGADCLNRGSMPYPPRSDSLPSWLPRQVPRGAVGGGVPAAVGPLLPGPHLHRHAGRTPARGRQEGTHRRDDQVRGWGAGTFLIRSITTLGQRPGTVLWSPSPPLPPPPPHLLAPLPAVPLPGCCWSVRAW